jgi:hypothetical protein
MSDSTTRPEARKTARIRQFSPKVSATNLVMPWGSRSGGELLLPAVGDDEGEDKASARSCSTR